MLCYSLNVVVSQSSPPPHTAREPCISSHIEGYIKAADSRLIPDCEPSGTQSGRAKEGRAIMTKGQTTPSVLGTGISWRGLGGTNFVSNVMRAKGC